MLKRNPNPDEDYELWNLLALVETGMGRARDNELKPFGISKLQAGVMFIIKATDGPAKVSDLSKCLFREPHTMNELVLRMEKQGLVERVSNSRDKRLKGILLTQQGEALFEAQNRERKSIHNIVSILTEEEQTTLRALFEKLACAVKDELPSKPNWRVP